MTTLMIEVIHGSRLFGTSTPESDLDTKRVVLPPARDILLGQVRTTYGQPRRERKPGEKPAPGEIETETCTLQRFLSMLAEGQTIAIEILFAPPPAILVTPGPLWREIVDNRDRLICRKAASFVSYARDQANKYGIRGSRVHTVRAIVEWFDAAIATHGHLTRMDVAAGPAETGPLAGFIAERGLIHTAIVHIASPGRGPMPHLECCNRKTPFFNSLKDARAIYATMLATYGERSRAAEQNDGVDWKALSHAVRVGREAIEFLSTGRLTFPLPPHRLGIARG